MEVYYIIGIKNEQIENKTFKKDLERNVMSYKKRDRMIKGSKQSEIELEL